MNLIADERIVVESPDPENIFLYTPAICRGKNNRLIASTDLGGPGVESLDGPLMRNGDFKRCNQLRVMVSDDEGLTWRETARMAMFHALLFAQGERLYLLGSNSSLVISASDDNGEHWSEPVVLNSQYEWLQSGNRICRKNGNFYISYEVKLSEKVTWPNSAPVLMAAKEEADLTDASSWRFSQPFDCQSAVAGAKMLGIPFYTPGDTAPENKKDPRYMGDPGILESNVEAIYNPQHLFYEPESVLIFMRAHTGLANIAAVLKGTDADGELKIELLKAPSGELFFYTPFPGGQMKFDLQYDPISKLYWLVSTQSTDAMTAPQFLPEERYNLPDNERRRMVLHFSKDAFSWCFAGVIAQGNTEKESRHYAQMQIDGEDILVFARSGDSRAKSAHNGNLLTLHRIRNFRSLAY